MKKIILFSISFPILLHSQTYISKSPVTILASRLQTVLVSEAREHTIIGPNEIERMPALSIADMLRWSGNIDLRPRGTPGVQSDFSLRGCSYDQVLVLVDGIRINDPQTGHHNSDIPVPAGEVERIEILQGPASALYGSDGFGGVINVITKSGRSKDNRIKIKAGGFGTTTAETGQSIKSGKWSGRFGAQAAGSDGYRPDTDYKIASLSHRTSLEWPDKTLDASIGYTHKDFGANGFYGPYPSYESTKALLASLRFGWSINPAWTLHGRAYAKRHDDRFTLDKERPQWYVNRHRTWVSGATASINHKIANRAEIVIGLEAERLELKSTNLSDHSDNRFACFGEIGLTLTDNTIIGAGFRVDSQEETNPEFCPSFSIVQTITRSIKWRASAGRAFRTPTFTERYYHSPSTNGNQGLKPESGLNVETGFSWKREKAFFDLTVFGRNEKNRIDWISESKLGPWKAENIGNTHIKGLSLTAGMDRLKNISLRASYTGLIHDNKKLDHYSKYGLYSLRHLASAAILADMPSQIQMGFWLSARRRDFAKTAILLDLTLSKEIGPVKITLEGTNLSDSREEDIPGIPPPGRSYMLGLEWVKKQ